jgi:hypothetical protein
LGNPNKQFKRVKQKIIFHFFVFILSNFYFLLFFFFSFPRPWIVIVGVNGKPEKDEEFRQKISKDTQLKSQIKSVITEDINTKEGLNQIKMSIDFYLEQRKIKITQSRYSLALITKQLSKSSSTISFSEYCWIANNICGVNKNDMESTFSWIHENGLALYFPEEISDIIFLDINFPATSLTNILSFSDNFRYGIAMEDEIFFIWSAQEGFDKSMQKRMLILLERFEILYMINDPLINTSYFFIPALLPTEFSNTSFFKSVSRRTGKKKKFDF